MVEGRAERRGIGEGPAADPRPGFQQQAAPPQRRQPARRGDPGGAGPDHHDIDVGRHHTVLKRTTSARAGSTTSRPWRSSRRRCASVSPTVKLICPISCAARGNSTWAAS